MSFVLQVHTGCHIAGILFLGSRLGPHWSQPAQPTSLYAAGQSGDLFGTIAPFLKMPAIICSLWHKQPECNVLVNRIGFEGFGMPVLFYHQQTGLPPPS